VTRTDYVELAAVLAWAHGTYESIIADAVVADITHGLAEVLAADNPRFDRARFLAAARGES